MGCEEEDRSEGATEDCAQVQEDSQGCVADTGSYCYGFPAYGSGAFIWNRGPGCH